MASNPAFTTLAGSDMRKGWARLTTDYNNDLEAEAARALLSSLQEVEEEDAEDAGTDDGASGDSDADDPLQAQTASGPEPEAIFKDAFRASVSCKKLALTAATGVWEVSAGPESWAPAPPPPSPSTICSGAIGDDAKPAGADPALLPAVSACLAFLLLECSACSV
jgi:hypothetical protein